MNSAPRPPPRTFPEEARRRFGQHGWTKHGAIALGLTAFFIAYFAVLRHPLFPVTTMPVTALDRWIGFHPEALPLYVSLWFYVPLAFALLQTPREMLADGLGLVTLSVVGLGLFFFWPTAVAPLEHDWSAYPSFAFLKRVDASGNACPSLHVAFAVLTAIRLAGILREMGAGVVLQAGNVLWCLGIVYSTLATGQHVAIDAAVGAALGALIAPLRFTRLRRGPA